MSLSRSPIWMQRPGSSRSSVDCFKFSSHRMLSFFSMGTGVGLIFFLSAAVPARLVSSPEFHPRTIPAVIPPVVIARLECIKIPQAVYILGLPARSRLLLVMHFVIPISSGLSR